MAALKFVVTVKDNESYKASVLDAPPTCLCIIDCFASWCGPCDALNKKIQNLYQDMSEFATPNHVADVISLPLTLFLIVVCSSQCPRHSKQGARRDLFSLI